VETVLGATHILDGATLNVIRAANRNKTGTEPAAIPKQYAHAESAHMLGFPPAMPPMGSMPHVAPPRPNRIYVGGIPPELGEAEMKNHFNQFGTVEDVYFPKGTGKGGFCFVRFTTPQSAEDAVARSQREISGRAIGEIKIAEPKPGDHAHAAHAAHAAHQQAMMAAQHAMPPMGDPYAQMGYGAPPAAGYAAATVAPTDPYAAYGGQEAYMQMMQQHQQSMMGQQAQAMPGADMGGPMRQTPMQSAGATQRYAPY